MISHEWNGTVLTITSDSGTSSMDLKGDKGCRGPQGPAGIIIDDLGNIDWNGYATEVYVQDLISEVEGGSVDLSGYAKLTDLPDLTGYATKTYVEELLGVIENGSY